MIRPDKRNANKGTKRGRELIRQSLKELGAGRSILLDRQGNIIAGNKTFAGAEESGINVRIIHASRNELIAVQRDDLDLNDVAGDARRLAYMDNRTAEIDLAWNAEQFAEDAEAGLGFDSLGFLEGELRVLLEEAGIGDALIDPGDQSDKADELVEKWGVCLGQVWSLGEHRLICADCTDAASVGRLMRGDLATLCFTSPPYWVGKSYETQKDEDEVDVFVIASAQVIHAFTRKDESRIVINTGTGYTKALNKKRKRHTLLLIDKWTDAFYALGWNLRHVRHWLKEGQMRALSPRADMIDQHCEFIGTYENQEGFPMGFEDAFNDDDVRTLLTFYTSQGKQRGQEWTGCKWALRSYWDDIQGTAGAHGHEAAFPVELPLRHVMLYTKRGEIVFEPFCGSGTTIIACEAMGRKCYAVELDPKYVASTLERWKLLTGKEPTINEQ
jgi:DNA modification methylase